MTLDVLVLFFIIVIFADKASVFISFFYRYSQWILRKELSAIKSINNSFEHFIEFGYCPLNSAGSTKGEIGLGRTETLRNKYIIVDWRLTSTDASLNYPDNADFNRSFPLYVCA